MNSLLRGTPAAGKIDTEFHQSFFLYNEEAALSSGRMNQSAFLFPEIIIHYSTCRIE
ncbi:hypothetical protein [Candidatus Electronema sp. TJ]|uniref:hypothetical protein n=1 Tax=Candidatus Electronema sp. TJ TaxID=3401573 RepID=UPI003AA92668